MMFDQQELLAAAGLASLGGAPAPLPSSGGAHSSSAEAHQQQALLQALLQSSQALTNSLQPAALSLFAGSGGGGAQPAAHFMPHQHQHHDLPAAMLLAQQQQQLQQQQQMFQQQQQQQQHASSWAHNNNAAAASWGGAGVAALPQHPAEPREHRTIFFAGCLPTVGTEALLSLFSTFGAVEDINLFRPFASSKTSKGCGLVVFARRADAQAALDTLSHKFRWPGARSNMVVEFYTSQKSHKKAKAKPLNAVAAANAAATAAINGHHRHHQGGLAALRAAALCASPHLTASSAASSPLSASPTLGAAFAAQHQHQQQPSLLQHQQAFMGLGLQRSGNGLLPGQLGAPSQQVGQAMFGPFF